MKLPKNKNIHNILIIAVISVLLEFVILKLWRADFKVPFIYYGGDENMVLMFFKSSEWSSNFFNKQIAAPFGTNMMDFKIIQIGKTSYFIHNILKLITGNTIVSVNIHNIIIPTIIAIVSYLVMKNLEISNLICICGSIVYAFLPFYFLRMYCHFYLASYYLVPVSVMLCFWILEDDNFFKFEGFLKTEEIC